LPGCEKDTSRLADCWSAKLRLDEKVGGGSLSKEIDLVRRVSPDSAWLGSRMLWGSTGDYCLRHAHCAVLVVKDDPLPPFDREHPDAIKNAAEAYREACRQDAKQTSS